MVTISDVRELLGQIDPQLLPDSLISKAISDATAFVSQKISSTNPLFDPTVKYYSAYLALISYLEFVRREVGRIPEDVLAVMNQLKIIADDYLRTAESLERSDAYTVTYQFIETTTSRWDHDPWYNP